MYTVMHGMLTLLFVRAHFEILNPIVSAFYFLLVFDTMGRDYDWQDGAAVVIHSVPLSLALFARFNGLCIPNYAKTYVDQQAKLDVRTYYKKPTLSNLLRWTEQQYH